MGIGSSSKKKSQFDAANYVLDYSVNLLHPDQYGQVMQRLGPNSASLPSQGHGQVLADINECLTNADSQARAKYARMRQLSLFAILIFVAGIILMVVLVLSAGSTSYALPITIVCGVAGIGLSCYVNTQQKKAGRIWRDSVMVELKAKLNIWKSTYPAFTFTIIYPQHEYGTTRRNGRRRRKLVAIWCYVRITQGQCQLGPNESVYAVSNNQVAMAPQVVVQQPVMAAPVQPVVIQQQQPQTVMVQTANGMTPAVPTVVNGQQVYMAVQPQPQQPQQPVVQQVVQPVAQSGYPAATGQPQQMVMVQQQQQLNNQEVPPPFVPEHNQAAPPPYAPEHNQAAPPPPAYVPPGNEGGAMTHQ